MGVNIFSKFSEIWRNLPSDFRLLISTSVLAISGTIAMTGMAIQLLTKERSQHVSELTRDRAFSQAAKARLILENLTLSSSGKVIDTKSISPKSVSLNRWPVKDEIFLSLRNSKHDIFWRDKGNKVVASEISALTNPWNTNEVTSYWFTNQGILIGSNTLKIVKDNFASRPLVKLFSQSSARSGELQFKEESRRVNSAFHEIQNSNLISAVEAFPLANTSFIPILVLIHGIISAIILLSFLWFIRIATIEAKQPFKRTIELLEQFNNGTLVAPLGANEALEVQALFAYVNETKLFLDERVRNLEHIQSGLHQLLAGTVEMHSREEILPILFVTTEMVIKNISGCANSNAQVYFVKSSFLSKTHSLAEDFFLTGQLAFHGKSKETVLFEGPFGHETDLSQATTATEPYVDSKSDILILPINSCKQNIGFLVFDQFNRKEIGGLDLFLLRAISMLTGSALGRLKPPGTHNDHSTEALSKVA